MDDELQQVVILDALLTNWKAIKLRMGPISPALAKQFNELAERLSRNPQADELSRIVNDLLDLTSGTPAEEYVRELVARSDLGGTELTREGATIPVPAIPAVPAPELKLAFPRLAQETAVNFSVVLAQSESVSGAARVPVFFSTNRQASNPACSEFSGNPQRALTYGVATVTVPLGHKTGQMETPSWWNIFADKTDETRFFTLSEVLALKQTEFEGKLETASQSAKRSDLLIFLHGFNVSFEEAAMRAAQFAVDSEFGGIVVLFSWPSQGRLLGYSGDEDRALSSGDSLATFLNALAAGPWSQVHLLAHSMGNRVMLAGLADNPRPKLKLGQLVFAAADVYVPVFDTKFAKLQDAGTLASTLYASKDDRALIISNRLHSGARVGLIDNTPYQTENLASIDATNVDRGILGHGYWSSVPALLSDLQQLLVAGRPPKERKLTPVGQYWEFPK